MRSKGSRCLALVMLACACGDAATGDPEPRDASASTEAGRNDGANTDAGAHDDAAREPVDPALELSKLSREQAERVCGALRERFDASLPKRKYVETSCVLQAWPISFDFSNITGELIGNPGRCQELVTMCLDKDGALGDFAPAKSLGDDLVDPVHCTEPAPGLDLAACAASVGDLETCAAAAALELRTLLERARCDALADPMTLELSAPQVDIAQLPACRGLQERCPGLSLDTLLDGQPKTASE